MVKSAGVTARLSVTVKFWSQRRVSSTSTEMRGKISCWIVAVTAQSDGRLYPALQDLLVMRQDGHLFSKFALLQAPQKSPPEGRRSCARPLFRSQSGW